MTEKLPPDASGEHDTYRTLTWLATEHNPERFDWIVLSNRRPPRFRRYTDIPVHQIGILTTPRAPLDHLQERWNGVQAIAYLDTDGNVSVGYDPEGEPLFGPDPTDKERYALGISIGTGGANAVIGIWAPQKGFFIDYETTLHEQKSTPDMLAQDFPDVPVVEL